MLYFRIFLIFQRIKMQFQEEFAHIFSWVRLAPDCSLPTHFAHIAEHHMQGTHHAELRSALLVPGMVNLEHALFNNDKSKH